MKMTTAALYFYESRRRRGFGGLGSLIVFCIFVSVIHFQTVNCEESTFIVTSSPAIKTSTSASTLVSVSSTVSSGKSDKKTEKHKKYVVVADKGDKSSSSSNSAGGGKLDLEPTPTTWDNNWVPMPLENVTIELLMPTPNTTPLTVAEQEKRLNSMNSFQNKKKQEIANQIAKDKMKYQQSASKPSSPSNFDKWSLESLRDQVFSYSQMLLDNFMNGVDSSSSRPPQPPKAKPQSQSQSRGKAKSLPAPDVVDQSTSGSAPDPVFGHYGQTGAPSTDSLAAASNLFNAAQSVWPAYTTAQNIYSTYGGESKSVVNWLARLIGVSGKTLGEFLREYQVHVLYDLVFTFFKWIFFLYAGLLIP